MTMLLSSQDHQRIEQSIATAEAATCGEIVCVVAEEAAAYVEIPLAWASAGALVLPIIPLTFGIAATRLDSALGGWGVAHIAASGATVAAAIGAYALLQSLLFIAIALLVSVPFVRRMLTPASLKRGHVHRRAMEQFFARDLHNTRNRTGILIYASLNDRVAEVIADTGIDAKVGPGVWDNIIAALLQHIKAGQPGDGFVTAIEKCGRLLATHFPADRSNPNELSNAIVEMPRQ